MDNPKKNEEKMRKMLKAWEDHAKNISFGGMTLEGFKLATARPLDSRARLADLLDKTGAEINVRDNEGPGMDAHRANDRQRHTRPPKLWSGQPNR